MTSELVVVGAAAAAALGVGLAYHQREKARAAAAAPAPVTAQPVASVGVAPAAEQAAQEAAGLKLPKLPPALGTGLATAVAGIKLQNLVGNIAERVGGEGAGQVARVAPVMIGAGVIAGKGAQAALESIGVANEPARVAGVVTGVAVVAGAPVAAGAAVAQVAGNALQAGLKAVAGEKVERAVSGAVSQFDPFKPGSAANTVVKPLAGAVKVVGSIFGGGPSPEEKARMEAERQAALATAQAALRAGTITTQQAISGAIATSSPVGFAGLIRAAQSVQVAAQPAVPPAPPPAVASVVSVAKTGLGGLVKFGRAA